MAGVALILILYFQDPVNVLKPTWILFTGLGMCAWGFFRMLAGTLPDVESATLEIVPAPGWEEPLTTIGLVFLLARAFSSGCAALTGVEAVSASPRAVTPPPRSCCWGSSPSP